MSFNANYSTNNSAGENYSEKAENDPIQQKSNSDNYNYSLNGGVTYAEPIGSHAQASIGYNVNYNKSNADRLTNLFDWETGQYNEFISPEYSNRNNTDYLTQRVGPGFRFSNDGTTVSAQVNYQNVRMNSDREYPAVYVPAREDLPQHHLLGDDAHQDQHGEPHHGAPQLAYVEPLGDAAAGCGRHIECQQHTFG